MTDEKEAEAEGPAGQRRVAPTPVAQGGAIEQQDERVMNGTVQTQHLTTQASGPLGEWLRLGGINETASSQQSGILSRQYSTQSDAREVWVKVEKTP